MLELSIHFDNNDKHWYVMNGKIRYIPVQERR